MRALYWDGSQLSCQSDYPLVAANSRQALVKIHLAGICATDLQILKGYMGFTGVPGHEFVGSVREGPEQWLGKRVVGEINFGCGQCEFCRRELSRHCLHRSVMGIVNADGAFAEYLSLPVDNLHVVPDAVDDEDAVFTEPLAAAFEILNQIEVDSADEILVIGDGKLGNLCAQVLHLRSAKVTVVGKHEDKLDLIKRGGVRAVLLQNWQPRLFDVAVEASGSAAGFELAVTALRPRGTLVLKSTIAGNHQVSLAAIVVNEIKVIGSRCGVFPDALAALTAGGIALMPLIEKIYPLAQGLQAFDHAGRIGAKKILLRP